MHFTAASQTVTATATAMHSFESHWDREEAVEYSTEHSTSVSWEIICPPRCYCIRRILVGKFYPYVYPDFKDLLSIF